MSVASFVIMVSLENTLRSQQPQSFIMSWSEEEMEQNLFPLELVGNLLLFLLVFGMSATVRTDSLQSQLKNTKAILTGVVLQFVILPLLGFVTVKVLDLDETMGITLLVVTSSPGGSYSNWWCSMFNADLALSVTMTTISTLLSILMLPVNLVLYANQAYEANVVEALDWEALFLSLFIVISAIGLGLACAATITWPAFSTLANKVRVDFTGPAESVPIPWYIEWISLVLASWVSLPLIVLLFLLLLLLVDLFVCIFYRLATWQACPWSFSPSPSAAVIPNPICWDENGNFMSVLLHPLSWDSSCPMSCPPILACKNPNACK